MTRLEGVLSDGMAGNRKAGASRLARLMSCARIRTGSGRPGRYLTPISSLPFCVSLTQTVAPSMKYCALLGRRAINCLQLIRPPIASAPVSYTHLRAHETVLDL